MAVGLVATLSVVTDLVGAVLTRPSLDVDEAARLLEDAWDIRGDLRPLPSERDRNFAVRVGGRDAFVLKISNLAEEPAFLEMQHAAMAILLDAGVPCQEPIPSVAGASIVRWSVSRAGEPLLARLLRWLPGRPLADVPPAMRSTGLLEDLGATMGRSARALARFDHPAAHRAFQWDAQRGLEVVASHASAVVDDERAALLARWRVRLAGLAGELPSLRHGVIHNDANDHNVLVADGEERISGLLDFGDMVHSITVNELAVAAAYAALDAPGTRSRSSRPSSADSSASSRSCPSRPSVVLDLVALRLCTSVALSAHQSRLAPGDAYLTISERPAWELLATLEAAVPR